MSRWIPWLAGGLVLQLLILAAMLGLDALRSGSSAEPLIPVEATEITALKVSDDADSVTLSRTEDGWRIEDKDLPADAAKVQEVLDKLTGAKGLWPTATSADSAQRFEVTEDQHQRRLALYAGDDLAADLLLGTSPGYRRVHARLVGENEIHALDFSNYEAPADAADWLDKSLLAAEGDVQSLSREAAWTLQQADGVWQLDGGPANETAATDLARRFRDLRVLDADAADDTDATDGADASDAGALAATYIVTDAEGAHRLSLYHNSDEDQYSLVSDRFPGRFGLAAYVAEQMLKDAADLAPEEAEAADAASEEPDADAGLNAESEAPEADGAGS